jgi:S1-C subfamily serine protease
MGFARSSRTLLLGTLKVLVLFAVFYTLEHTILGPRLGSGGGLAEAMAPPAQGRQEPDLNAAVEVCIAEVARARDEIESIAVRDRSERESLKAFLDDRTRDLQGILTARLEEERTAIEVAASAVERDAERVQKLTSSVQRDTDVMKRRMIYPTVQLKGNGTVGSGILVYSEPQHGIGEEGGSTVHTTLVLTAYHVVLEVMGERAERGMVDEVHVVKDADTSATEVFGAKLVLFDRARDVALLRLNSERRFEKVVDFLPPAELTSVDIFSKAYAVGCPLGNRPLPTLGEVSSKSKIVSDQVFWMLSAPTFFGNSGGGVYLAENCRLIGVSSMIYTYGKTNPTVVPHMGLFVPLETVYRWLDAEGYAFVHQRTPIPQEMLWKLAYVEKSAPVPRAASGPAGH